MTLARGAAAALLLGMALMLAFDVTVTRVLGLALMLGGIVAGVFAIATPVFLEGDAGTRGRPED